MGGIAFGANGPSIDKTSEEYLEAIGIEDASEAVIDAAAENPGVAQATEGLDADTTPDSASVDAAPSSAGPSKFETAAGLAAVLGLAYIAKRGGSS